MSNWYLKIRRAMALEPGAYRTDPNPHRLTRHKEVVRTPMGLFRQKIDFNEVDREYDGVHLTDSLELAAIYANNKSSENDPPVIIELYKDDLEGIPDIDAKGEELPFRDFMSDNKERFESILNNVELDSQEKLSEIVYALEDDIQNREDYGEIDDPSDAISKKERAFAESALISYLQSYSNADQSLTELRSLIGGRIPDQILISLANQFRVMRPIGSESVHAIYQMERVNLDEFRDAYQLEQMDEDELEDEGITKVDGEYLDSEGRRFVGFEDIDNGWWISKRVIYQDNRSGRFDYTYHGTSLSRAKIAYPELLQ